MLEKHFRASLIKELGKVGVFAVPIESATSPGFPDIVAANHSIALIECKIIMSANSGRNFKMLFELNQLAFYHRWWRTGANNLWCAVYERKHKKTYTFRMHPDHFKLTIKEMLAQVTPGSTARAAAFIGGNT